MMSAPYPFDRPIIIVSAPRSGSTLLFETLARSGALWSIGDESHMIFERIEKLNPQFGHCTSNRLQSDDADSDTVAQIRGTFLARLRNSDGVQYSQGQSDEPAKPRFLEKTPKNSLRIPFLNEVFPDASYIYLYRDPRENLSSMIEAWRSGRFVTYTDLPAWPGDWSVLLPPDYGTMQGKALEEIVAFQWREANQFIVDDLGKLPRARWTAVSFAEFVADPSATVRRLCEFAEIPFDAGLKAHCARELPLSRYTLSAPTSDKWRMNAAMIERVMPGLQPLVETMEAVAKDCGAGPVMVSGPVEQSGQSADAGERRPARNERCPCGSGLRFKHCHGKLAASEAENHGTDR